MPNQSSVLYTLKEGIATLTLNRPEVRNAFDDTTIHLLNTHLNEIQINDQVKILVLRGTGEHFSAGGDIQWMQRMVNFSKDENYKDAENLAQLMDTLYHLNKPTIIVLKGTVFGGATGLVACSDFALATGDTTFCFSEVKLGLVPAIVGPYIVSAIGSRAAKQYMLSAEPFSADTALQLGLIFKAVSSEALEQRLNTLIQNLLQNGPLALRTTKALIHKITDRGSTHQSLIEYTTRLIAELRVSKEGQEGLLAFLEKRKPKWAMS